MINPQGPVWCSFEGVLFFFLLAGRQSRSELEVCAAQVRVKSCIRWSWYMAEEVSLKVSTPCITLHLIKVTAIRMISSPLEKEKKKRVTELESSSD